MMRWSCLLAGFWGSGITPGPSRAEETAEPMVSSLCASNGRCFWMHWSFLSARRQAGLARWQQVGRSQDSVDLIKACIVHRLAVSLWRRQFVYSPKLRALAALLYTRLGTERVGRYDQSIVHRLLPLDMHTHAQLINITRSRSIDAHSCLLGPVQGCRRTRR